MKLTLLLRKKSSIGTLLCWIILGIYQLPVHAISPTNQAEEILLEEAFQLIGNKFGVFFNYDQVMVNDIKVNYNADKHMTLDATLEDVLGQADLKFQIFEMRYVAVYQDTEEGVESLKRMVIHFQGIIDKKELERKRKSIRINPLRTYSTQELYNKRLVLNVSGRVMDVNGEPLIGVNVKVKGTNKGTATDIDGRFTLNDLDDKEVLVVSFIGYKTQEISVDGQTSLTIIMREDAQTLDEIVVIGYGSMKKSDLTGSISSVRSEELNAFPSGSAIQALQGRAAGVQIKSDNGGEPGGNYNILIRGGSSINASSNPLYVVDGFPQGMLPPSEDIESIEILKDASATAIYGSRGANGVVLITTKDGAIGSARVNFNTSYSMQNEINRYNLLNAQQYAELINTINESNGNPHTFDNPTALGVGTDWQDEILQMGNIKNSNLSVSGGSDKIKYYISGVYYDQKGIILNSGFKRYSLTSNININVSDKVKFGFNTLVVRNDQNRLSTQEGTTSSQGGGVLSTALLYSPIEPIYREDGSYAVAPLGVPIDNPVALALERLSQRVSNDLQTSISGEFKLLKSLEYKAVFGVGTNNSRAGRYISSKLVYGNTVGGIANIDNSNNLNILAENYLTYSKDLGENSSLTALGGYSYQSFSSEGSSARGSDFLTDAGTWWNLGGASIFQQPTSNLTESVLSSLFGRINYSLNDRYLFTVNTRYDGSSRFAKNNKWAFFPSGAFAWNIHKENFISQSELISQLKLRSSYGITGNQAINPYQSLARFRYVFSVDNGKIVNAVSPLSVANSDLAWESTAQTDIGLDLGLFNNQLIVNADYYSKVTSDLLFSVPLPEYSGFTSQLKNIGKVENKGFELVLQVSDIIKSIQWNSKINLSLNRNTVIELPGGNEILYRSAPGQFVGVQTSQIIREGEALGSFYGFIYEGVQQEGDEMLEGAEGVGGERFRDLNNDGKLTDEDRTIIGNPNPKLHWGWNNDFSIKNFDIQIFVQGIQGNDMLNYTRMGLESLYSGVFNSTSAILDSWTPNNTNTDIPKIVNRSQRLSSRWVEDGSFIRLENIVLGYTFPNNFLDRINLSSLRIYASGQKLLTLTNYKGFDPEVSWSSGNRNIGIDYGSYPSTRNFTFGINVGF